MIIFTFYFQIASWIVVNAINKLFWIPKTLTIGVFYFYAFIVLDQQLTLIWFNIPLTFMKLCFNYENECVHIAIIVTQRMSIKESSKTQKQPSRGVFRKRCSENMKQIYGRTPSPKCNFNTVALQLYWNCTLTWVLSCKFVTYFQNTFS